MRYLGLSFISDEYLEEISWVMLWVEVDGSGGWSEVWLLGQRSAVQHGVTAGPQGAGSRGSTDHKERPRMRLDLFQTRAVMKHYCSPVFQVMQHGTVGRE